jgi:hypothetical protein
MTAEYRDDHPGPCCESCLQDKDAGYADDLYDVCCCEQLRHEDRAEAAGDQHHQGDDE